MKRLSLCVVLLAGCAAVPNDPSGVRLINETLTVTFENGANCTVDIADKMSGRLPNCVETIDYRVTDFRPALLDGTVLGQFFESYGTIHLTRPSDGGTWTFVTPPTNTNNALSGQNNP